MLVNSPHPNTPGVGVIPTIINHKTISMAKEDITPESLPDGADVTSSGDEGAVDSGISLEQLNKHLGKEFKDVDTALKSLKDTFSYVGKKKEDIVKEVAETPNGDFVSRGEYERKEFYRDNPEYKDMSNFIESMAIANGVSREEVIKDESFSSMFEQVKGYRETQQKKSVLHSNPVLKKSGDALDKAREAANYGNRDLAEKTAAQAVIDAYGLNN